MFEVDSFYLLMMEKKIWKASGSYLLLKPKVEGCSLTRSAWHSIPPSSSRPSLAPRPYGCLSACRIPHLPVDTTEAHTQTHTVTTTDRDTSLMYTRSLDSEACARRMKSGEEKKNGDAVSTSVLHGTQVDRGLYAITDFCG